MDRNEQLTVWQQEIAALRGRIAEGRSVVGSTPRLNLTLDCLQTAEQFLELEKEGKPVPAWT